MTLVAIGTPASVVTAAEAKAARVFTADDDNTYVQLLLDTAQATIDGPNGWLRRAVGVQTLELRGWCFSGEVRLPLPPVAGIVSVTYDDAAGVAQTVAATNYRLIEPDRLVWIDGFAWPSARNAADAVRIRYTAGYTDVPKPIKHAVMLMAADLKGFDASAEPALRSETVDGVGRFDFEVSSSAVAAMNVTADRLLSLYRVYST